MSIDHIYSNAFAESIVRNMSESLCLAGKKDLWEKSLIVDLGCGDGSILHELKKSHPATRMVGVDRNPLRKYSDVGYRTAIITATQLPNDSAAVVLSVNISDYLGDSFESDDFFNEVNRILVPGGVYIPNDFFRTGLIRPFQHAGYRSFMLDYQEKPQS